jgi:hypothetical protein
MMDQIAMLEQAATILAALDERITFTGGITIALYLDEISASDVRPTLDVDCVIEVTSTASYYKFADKLRQIGIQECQEEGAPLCRWQRQDLILDIMPTEPSVLGFSNSWYKSGIATAIPHTLPSGQQIWIFSIAYLLASKIEAFQGRGNRSFYGSHDFEDIVLLLDGCPTLEAEVDNADATVKAYLVDWFRTELANLKTYAPAHLSSVSRNAGREKLLLERLRRLAGA